MIFDIRDRSLRKPDERNAHNSKEADGCRDGEDLDCINVRLEEQSDEEISDELVKLKNGKEEPVKIAERGAWGLARLDIEC